MTTLRILVADDNADVRRGLKELLGAQPGWLVVGEAMTGRDAVEKAAQLGPDLVILDISMPELDGISAASLIRQAVPQAELLVLSQHNAPEMVKKALDAGVRCYVLKPDAAVNLVAAVEAARQHTRFLSAGVSLSPATMQSSDGHINETGLASPSQAGGPKEDVKPLN